MTRIAVILFPGTNCEEETKRAVESVGMESDIVRWNARKGLEDYDGYILPGGFSYEDRVRAGVIAAQDRLMDTIREQAKSGKPVLGICNGAQVLIETGIVPGLEEKVEMALAPNINLKVGGFYCTWTYVKNEPGKNTNAFNRSLENNEIIPIPIAHGEGRFTTRDSALLEKLKQNKQVVFRYCDRESRTEEFPINPNNSLFNIAGICNPKGNVLAMMPHPERASWNSQIPLSYRTGKDSPARKIFQSMKEHIEEGSDGN